jgi:Tfp pilus assembly protein PilN
VRAVNLLPRDERRRGGPSIPTPVAITSIAGFTLMIAVLGLLFVNAQGTVKTRRLELSQKQEELAAIPVPAQSRLQQQDALVADKQARVTALNAALAKRVAWDRVLREFALVLPDDVWLMNLSAKAPSPATTAPVASASTSSTSTSTGSSTSTTPTLGGSLGFSVEGHTYSHDAVARLLARLSLIPDLEQVQLVTSEQAKVGSRTIIHFKISANVRAPGASS